MFRMTLGLLALAVSVPVPLADAEAKSVKLRPFVLQKRVAKPDRVGPVALNPQPLPPKELRIGR